MEGAFVTVDVELLSLREGGFILHLKIRSLPSHIGARKNQQPHDCPDGYPFRYQPDTMLLNFSDLFGTVGILRGQQ